MAPDRFAILVQGYLDRTLTPAEVVELGSALAADPALVDPFLDQITVAGGCGGGDDLERLRLQLDRASGQISIDRLAASRRFSRPVIRWGWWAAAACLVVGTAALALLRPAPPAATGPTVALPIGVHLSRPGGPADAGPATLRPGDRLTANADAPLPWSAGVTLDLTAGTVLAVDAAGHPAVETGTVSVAVDGRPPRSLSLQVPGGTITDIGTRYEVAVGTDGTSIAVNAGQVEVAATGGVPQRIDRGGMARLHDGRVSILPWNSADLGPVSAPGTTVLRGDRIQLRSTGGDIFRTADGCRFLWRVMGGDWDSVVRLEGVTRAQGFSKAGLMVRASVDPASAQAAVLMTSDHGLMLIVRDATGRLSRSQDGIAVSAPTWVRLSRRGGRITAAWSQDGTAWTDIGTVTARLPAEALVGPVVSSVNVRTASTATFSGWTVTARP